MLTVKVRFKETKNTLFLNGSLCQPSILKLFFVDKTQIAFE